MGEKRAVFDSLMLTGPKGICKISYGRDAAVSRSWYTAEAKACPDCPVESQRSKP